MFLSQGQTVQEVMRQLATAEQTHHCWQGRQVERNVGHVMSPDYCTGWLSARVLMRRTVLGAAQSLEDIYGRSRGGNLGQSIWQQKVFSRMRHRIWTGTLKYIRSHLFDVSQAAVQ